VPQRFLRNSTVKVGEALQMAIMELANLRKGLVTAEFILSALVEQKDSVVIKLLDELGKDTGVIRREIGERAANLAQTLPDLPPKATMSMQLSQDVQNLFVAANAERQKLGDAYIATGAVFLGCIDANVPGTKKALTELGLDRDSCANALAVVRGSAKIVQKDDES
jgi:ATP-dependent Clp protease ATP-binding subunit ClpC